MPVNIGTEKAKLYLGEIEISGGGGGGIEGGYNVTLNVNGSPWQVVSVTAGKSIECLTSPTLSGKAFIGWATTQVATTPDVSFPITPNADMALYAVFATWHCTIANLGNSSISSVSFNHEGTMPTFEEVTFNGDKFIKFPTMYRKVVSNPSSQITSFIVSTSKEDANFQPYPCFLKEDGVSILPYILMGKYCSSSSTTANSISQTGATMTIGTGRTICRNRGTGYQQMDWMIFKLWQDLLIAKMETVNTNSGSGIQTDQLGVYWGTNYPWIDGVSCQGSAKKWVLSYKPSKYVDSATSSTDGYVQASYSFSGSSGQEISKLGYDSSNEFFNYPVSTTSNSSYNTYYCDGVYFGSSATHPVRSRVGDTVADVGAFYCSASYEWTSAYGVRLCYRPLSA